MRGMNAKQMMMLVGVALVLFYTITQPQQAADAVQSFLGWMQGGAAEIIGFFRNLFW